MNNFEKIKSILGSVKQKDGATHKTMWRLQKFADDEAVANNTPFSDEEIENNILVNTGINEMWKLIAGVGGTQFDNANAYLGVGDDDTAESASQTDLQAVTNKLRKAMNVSYPTYGTSQKVTFQADFTSFQC